MKVMSFVCGGNLVDLLVNAAQPVVVCLCGSQPTFQAVNLRIRPVLLFKMNSESLQVPLFHFFC